MIFALKGQGRPPRKSGSGGRKRWWRNTRGVAGRARWTRIRSCLRSIRANTRATRRDAAPNGSGQRKSARSCKAKSTSSSPPATGGYQNITNPDDLQLATPPVSTAASSSATAAWSTTRSTSATDRWISALSGAGSTFHTHNGLGSQSPSTFSQGLAQAMASSRASNGYWLAAADTICTNPFRNIPSAAFDRERTCFRQRRRLPPRRLVGDHIMCRDSVTYRQFPGFPTPSQAGSATRADRRS